MAQKAVEEGKEPGTWPLPIDREHLGIGEDDFKALYIIVVEAYHQIKANFDVYLSAGRTLDQSSVIARQESNKKGGALNKAYAQQDTALLDGVRARLQQELTEDGFKKADSYIYHLDHGGENFLTHPNSKKLDNSSATPAPAQSQGVQP